MKNGYYLSTYLHINKLGNLMNLEGRHDQSIALWEKKDNEIKLIHYWELERLTGVKMFRKYFYDTQQAKDLVNELLSAYQLSLDDMNEVWGTPELDKGDTVYHSMERYPEYAYHAIAHLFSSLFLDSEKFYNETILGMAVDGSPDTVVDKQCDKKPYYVGCISRKGKIELVEIASPGILWQTASEYYKLREGTLMALATACKCEMKIALPKELSFLDVHAYAESYEVLRYVVTEIRNNMQKPNWKEEAGYDERFTEQENEISMVMKVINQISIVLMRRNVDTILKEYNVKPEDIYLAMSGGYALNCPTNSYLLKEYGFKGFMAPPCTSDTGMALGIGLYAFYQNMDKVNFKLRHAYYGNRYQDIAAAIQKGNYENFVSSVTEFDVKQVVKDLQEAPLVWFNGAAEIGPRALGNRSIIADPRKEASKDILNKVKQRQWWRPVAPIVLEEDVNEWFLGACPSPYMLLTFEIREDKLGKIPAVSHLDRSSRVQTINQEIDETGLYDVIRGFKEETGVPIICNTSLNDRGEPIINTIEEAMNFALRKNIHVMYVNKQRVELKNHDQYLEKEPYKRSIAFQEFSKEEKEALLEEENPFHLSKEEINIYINSNIEPEFIDIRKKKDIRKMKVFAQAVKRMYGEYYDSI